MEKYSTCYGCALFDAPMAVNEKITNPDIVVVGGFPLEEDCKKAPFAAYKSMVVKKLLLGILNKMPAHKKPVIAYTYATMCCPKAHGFKVDAETVYKCASNLMSYLDRMRPKVIVAMGADAAKSLGIKGSQSDVRGGSYTIRLSDGTECRCIATYHIAQVDKSPGLLPVLQNDLQKAVTLATTDADDFKMEIKTAVAFEDVVALLDETEEFIKGATAEMAGKGRKLIVAVDTETTSVLPWHPDTRMIAVSMSYNNSSCLAYPVTHVAAGFTPAQIAFVLERTEQILAMPYLSIVMSNGKFDNQWLRYKYKLNIPVPEHDTMLLEHVLEEDKKGEYGLKDLIRDRVPALGGYEGELHEDLEAITATRHNAAKSAVDTLKEQYVEAVGTWWVSMDDALRSSLLARWIDTGHLQMSETASFAAVKYKKTKDQGLVPTKKYMTQVVKLVQKIPMDELESGDPSFAASVKDIKDQMAIAAEVKPATFEDIDIHKLLTYAAIDAFGTRTIFGMQLSRVKQEAAVMDNINKRLKEPLPTPPINVPYTNITMPMSNVLADMEFGGIRFDRDKALQYIDVVKEKMAEKLDAMYTEVGYKFNTSASAPDLARILYTEMGLPVLKTTDSGAPSTDADTLKELSDRHDNPFLSTILEYRKLDKCVNTYLISWYNKSAVDGKIHCSYNQIGTATYRLSSSNPNLGRSLEVVKPRELRGHPTA